jgi:hypothetical protein
MLIKKYKIIEIIIKITEKMIFLSVWGILILITIWFWKYLLKGIYS